MDMLSFIRKGKKNGYVTARQDFISEFLLKYMSPNAAVKFMENLRSKRKHSALACSMDVLKGEQ